VFGVQSVHSLAEVAEDLFPSAVKWAFDCGDQLFLWTSRFMHLLYLAVRSLARLELLKYPRGHKDLPKLVKSRAKTLAPLAPSADTSAALKMFRLTLHDFVTHFESVAFRDGEQLPEMTTEGFLHCEGLDGKVKFLAVAKSLAGRGSACVDQFRETWTGTLSSLRDHINANIPPYQLCKETLLQHKDVMMAMISNMKGFTELAPQCQRMKDAIKHVKAATVREPVVNAEVLSSCETVQDAGIEAVVFTFVVWYVLKELPDCLNFVDTTKCVDAIIATQKKYKVPLTDEMDKLISDLQSEEVNPEDLKRRYSDDAPVQSDAPAAPAPAPLQDAPPAVPEAAPAAVVPAAAPAPPAEEPAAAPQAPPSKKRRLIDRLKK
jgi:hypothetical protein